MNKRYPTYKPCGLGWVGEIPDSWMVNKFSRLAFFQEGPGLRNWQFKETGVRVICVTNITEEGINFDLLGRYISEEEYEASYKHFTVQRGDYLLSSSGASWGKVAEYTGHEDVILNTSTIRFNSANTEKFSKDFCKWLIKSTYVKEQLIVLLTGSCQPNFGPSHLSQLMVVYPKNLHEQQIIANYLDQKTALIGDAIQKKQQLIELLQEERTALINQAVTRGLNPDVKLKPSGVEWLGNVPEHWNIRPLKYVGACQNGVSANAEYFGSGYPFVSYGDVYKNITLPEKVTGLAMSTEVERDRFSVLEGDVFFTRTSETIEEIGLTSTCMKTIEEAVFAGFLIRFRPFEGLLFKGFSKYFFRSELHRRFFVKEMNLVTRASLSQELLKRLPILLPPIDEQVMIAKALDQKMSDITQIIIKAQQEILLLQEYRTALINEVVTGKRCVVPIPDEALA